MTNRTTKIRCVTQNCQAFNSIEDEFCHQCSTPIVKNYLWIKGELTNKYKIGELINERFLLSYPQIVLDLNPALVIDTPQVIPKDIKVYLKLFSHRLHLPQVYGYLSYPEQAWLLEYETVPINAKGKLTYPKFFPSIQSCLSKVSALRQINWLWQIANLWIPLAQQKALSSFFLTNNIRVNGGIVKLIELKRDRKESTPTLQNLGHLWNSWLPLFNPVIHDLLTKIIFSLQQNLFTDIEQLLAVLDQILYILGNNYYQRQYQVITATDTGTKKPNNEDACYPPPNQLIEAQRGFETLSIVCDGLGGQDAGEVASNLAVNIINLKISSYYQYSEKRTLEKKHWTPSLDAENIYRAVAEANNQITQLNDTEKRNKKQRMGTTANVGMALAHEIYLANVGDSRTYWITSNSCHQVTLDDDIATKKVQQGEELYRSISATPKGGVLLQALGMEYSDKLNIHLKRLILDEDSVFLLCSDGLSDLNRVEQYWYSEIRPLIQHKADLPTVAKNLMDIGINKNGYDNISLALLYCQVQKREKVERPNELSWKYLATVIPNLPQPRDSDTKIFSRQWISSPVNIIIFIIIVLFCGGGAFWWWNQQQSSEEQSQENIQYLGFAEKA
jgi:protein phosphatase